MFGWGFTLLMNLLFDMRYADIDCAFQALPPLRMEVRTTDRLNDHKIFTVEWLWKAKRSGLNIKELPVRHYQRIKGTQTGARLDVIWQMVGSLLRLRLQFPASSARETRRYRSLLGPADSRIKK